MNIQDVRKCAQFFKDNYVECFYIVTTYNDNSFILVGEKNNFPHLMGIERKVYNSNGYAKGKKLYEDLLDGEKAVSRKIIRNNIAKSSKMYKKVLNFCSSTDILWHNKGPLAINYNCDLSTKKLNNVAILLVDLGTGYMSGWQDNKDIPISEEICLKKYCFTSWIDESARSTEQKEKYMPKQDIEIIRSVLQFDKYSKLKKEKQYDYDRNEKISILRSIERNQSNLVINNCDEDDYKKLAQEEGIKCKINDIQY